VVVMEASSNEPAAIRQQAQIGQEHRSRPRHAHPVHGEYGGGEQFVSQKLGKSGSKRSSTQLPQRFVARDRDCSCEV